MRLTIVTPAFNEAMNLEALYERLAAAMQANGLDWEWIVVDDHSHDATFDVVRRLAARDSRIGGVRFARNFGSHTAIACGLHHARGDAAVALAADLQDPPETFAAMVAEWRRGAQVVWAVRRQRQGERHSNHGFAAVYYFLMRHLVGMKEMPASGADFFLVDRVVLDAFRQFSERHVSILALITWMGYRQAFIEYDKQARRAGASGWTLRKKIKLVVDSIVSFSEFPIRLCTYTGGLLLAAGIVAAPVLGLVTGLPPRWAALVALLLALSGVHLIALGLVGEYVWRALDEARRRPPYLIEASAGLLERTPAATHG